MIYIFLIQKKKVGINMWKGYKINIDKNSKFFDDKGLDYYKDKILKNIT